MNVENLAPRPILVEVLSGMEMIPEVIILPTAIIPMAMAMMQAVVITAGAATDIDFILM